MSAALAVHHLVQGFMPLVNEASVTFTVPAGTVEPVQPGGTVTLVVNAAALAGSTEVEIRNDTGDGLAAEIPAGAVVTVGGNSYSVRRAWVRVDILHVSIATGGGLVADVADGDPVTLGAAPIEVEHSSTVSRASYPATLAAADVSFAFQVARLDLALPPARGWHVERTHLSGQVERGYVFETDTTDAVCICYIGTEAA